MRHEVARRAIITSSLLAMAAALGGCGPASLTSHLPHRPSLPHFYFHQKSGPVQAPLEQFILPAGTLFPSAASVSQLQSTDLALPTMSPTGTSAAVLDRWRPQGSALATYTVTPKALLPGSQTLLTVAQVQVLQFAAAADADNWLSQVIALGPAYAKAQRMPNPGFGSLSAHYAAALTGHFSGDLIYFQARNVIARIVTIVPPGTDGGSVCSGIADREYGHIGGLQ